jgi:pseudaminic acid cytidylyltransferase
MSNIAIIPARGGSQRVPRKNIKLFRGNPIISYPIKALRESGLFEQILVSTDDDEIADISLKSGADKIIRRSLKLGENSTPTVEVISSAIQEEDIDSSAQICVAYATNPLLSSAAIKVAYQHHLGSKISNYTTTLTKYGFPPQRSLELVGSNLFTMISPLHMYTNSQDLPPIFHETGQFWWGKADKWMHCVGMQLDLAGILLPEWMAQDIDDEDDWFLAEAKFDFLQKNSSLNWSEKDILEYNSKHGIEINL